MWLTNVANNVARHQGFWIRILVRGPQYIIKEHPSICDDARG